VLWVVHSRTDALSIHLPDQQKVKVALVRLELGDVGTVQTGSLLGIQPNARTLHPPIQVGSAYYGLSDFGITSCLPITVQRHQIRILEFGPEAPRLPAHPFCRADSSNVLVASCHQLTSHLSLAGYCRHSVVLLLLFYCSNHLTSKRGRLQN